MNIMGAPAEKLALEAMALPAPERAELAHKLLVSLDSDADADAEMDADGLAEAVRRLGEIERGEVKPIAEDELFRRVRSRLGR